MLERIENRIGYIDIERPVAAKIIKETIMRHRAVAAITNAKGQHSSIFRKLSFDRNAEFIKIVKNKENKIEIEIYLILMFGAPISMLTKNIIKDIRRSLFEDLDLEPDLVRIIVVGLKSKRNVVERRILMEG